MLKYELTKLENGLRIITAPIEKTKAASILFLFGVGSRYETEKLSGISHFLEHMFFKGTKKRPTTLDISKELDGVGAGYNAYTGEENTGYFVHVPSKHFDLGLDVLSDMIFNSKFDEKEITKEKGVIIEEINMYEDEPRGKVELVAKELVYGKHPLGWKITGEKETVTKFTRNDFVNYKKSHYNPENMVIAVAGNIDNNVLDKLKEKFGQMQILPKNEYLKVKEEQSSPQIKIHYKETEQSHFIIGFRSIKRTDAKHSDLRILTNLMGQMMSSRLFIEVREKRGLCYYVAADMADFNDTGFWSVSAGVDNNRVEEALEVILKEIEKLKNEPVSQEELKRAQENLKGHLYLNLEDSMSVASFLAEQELFWERIQDPDEIATDYDKVTAEDIQDLAQNLFISKHLNLALLGPFKNNEKFSKILEKYR